MREVTNSNRRFWLLFIFICTTYVPSTIYAKALSISTDPRLIQLLDSAEILKYKHLYGEAIQLCFRIKEESKIIKDWEINALSLAELGDIYLSKLDYNEASRWLELSFQNIEQNSLRDSQALIRYLIYSGKLHRGKYSINKKEHADSVLNYYLKAEGSANRGDIDPKELIKLNYEFGRHYYNAGEINKSEFYYNKTIDLIEKHLDNTNYLRGRYYYNIGSFNRKTGDYERAILLAKIANHIFQLPKNNDQRFSLFSEILLANSLYMSEQYDKALNIYDRVIKAAEGNDILSFNYLLNFNVQRLVMMNELNKYSEAIKAAKKLLKENNESSFPDGTSLYNIYSNLAESYAGNGEKELANRYFKKSIETRIDINGENDMETYFGYKYYGDFYQRAGNHEKALLYFQKATISLIDDFKSEVVFENPDYMAYDNKEIILYLIFPKSVSLFNQYLRSQNTKYLYASFSLFQTAYGILNAFLNSELTDQSAILKFKYFEQNLNLSIECALELYKITGDQTFYNQAFQFIENNKYFLLQKALRNTRHSLISNVSDSLLFKQRILNKEIIEFNQQLSKNLSVDSAFHIRNLIMSKLRLSSEIENTIHADPNYKNINISDSIFLTIPDVQQLLSDNSEIIIEFNWSDSKLYSLIIGKDFIDFDECKLTDSLLNSIQIYKQIISGEFERESNNNAEFNRYIKSSTLIYNKVLKPIISKVENHPDFSGDLERIIFVPDGQFSTLPFEPLLTKAVDTSTKSYWSLPYFFKDYTISYAYSLNILKNNLIKRNKKVTPKLLGFSYSAPVDLHSNIALLRSENELPYSSEELDRIENWIKRPMFFKDDEATEDIFKSEVSNYSLLHLALHGRADTTDMFNSSLKFKINENSIEDGELHAFEMYDMDLSNIELAVLSACETGVGRQAEGEGIFSIARGFAYAGCPSIVLSLWKVNDKSTSVLMDYFYKYLSEGDYKDVALQKAKLSFINNSNDLGAHPANWAAFIALGNNKPIQLPKFIISVYHILAACLLFGIIFTFIVRKKKLFKFRWE